MTSLYSDYVIPLQCNQHGVHNFTHTYLTFTTTTKWRVDFTRVGISGTTAKSRKRKFIPSSHPGPLALVASPGKSKTKVGTLACFDFFVKE